MFKSGDYFVICDRCGFKRYRSQCKKEWTGLIVCSDTCFDHKHPQLTIKPVKDQHAVPDARPEGTDVYVSTANPVTADDL